MNLLPIPALDGGRLVFLVIEAIRRKPSDPLSFVLNFLRYLQSKNALLCRYNAEYQEHLFLTLFLPISYL